MTRPYDSSRKMRRAASPTPSEGEVDILGSLYPGEDDAQSQDNGMDLDFGEILEAPEAGKDDADGDEAFIALQQAASFRKTTNLRGKSAKKGGGFQSMGLNANLLQAIKRKGFSVPTPIQRKAIPLILARKDVVGMARTGSGKTAAFVIPMIERLRAHSARVGARALILSPSRELAIQTLKVVREFGKGTDLKSILLVGGDSLEEQFRSMSSNPDIVIATPGRFLHLKVEMSLNLSTIQYVVFDEADRLFEMGFATQLTEILHALPPSRQTFLFSATLPQSLVEFARAGLQEPSLVRLDAETKVSPDLQSAFFGVKGQEKEGALLYILNEVIGMPLGLPEGAVSNSAPPATGPDGSRKRKRGGDWGGGRGKPTPHSTIIFAATKHHVEFLAALLAESGFAVSFVYGSLDQAARRTQVDNFRSGQTNILVVTDVAARGIDIPILANVINYDFPPQPKLFVHRVGRTARAGQRGWSYSLVRDVDAPYLLDLQLFLGRRLVVGREKSSPSFAADVVVGTLPRYPVEARVEWVVKTLNDDDDMMALRRVAEKGEALYVRTRNPASAESAKRARECVAARAWSETHALFDGHDADDEQARSDMLAKISGFRPQETIFEIWSKGKGGASHAAEVMKQLRRKITPRRHQENQEEEESLPGRDDGEPAGQGAVDANPNQGGVRAEPDREGYRDSEDGDGDGDEAMEVTVSNAGGANDTGTFRDSEIYMSYVPRNVNAYEERGYGVQSGGTNASSFVQDARNAAMDLANDETSGFGEPTRAKMRWDKKNSKYVSTANDDDGSKGAKMIRGESGVKIAASFKSGRFDRWRKAQRIGRLPRVGETEKAGGNRQQQQRQASGPRYRHTKMDAPKEADKHRDNYLGQKKRVAEAREKRIGRFKDGLGSRREIKGIEDVHRARKEKERKKQKNARPSKRQKT